MIQYNTLNVKSSNSQLNKLKVRIKNGTQVNLNLSSNVSGSFNNEINFPHKLLLTNTQISKIDKAFANGSTANIKFWRIQLSEMAQSGGFLPLRFLLNSENVVHDGVKKIQDLVKKAQDLAKKVPDDFIKTRKVANVLTKTLIDKLGKM